MGVSRETPEKKMDENWGYSTPTFQETTVNTLGHLLHHGMIFS